MKKEIKIKKIVSRILLVAIIVGLFVGYKVFEEKRNIPSVMLINPEIASFNRTLNLNATVQAETSQTIKNDLGLKVNKFLVDEGEQVKKGQSLVLYSRKSAKKELSKAEQKLEDLEKKKEKQEEEMNALINNLASTMMGSFNLDMGSAANILKSNLGNIDLSKEMEKLVSEFDIKKELESFTKDSQSLKEIEYLIGTTAGFVQNLQNTVYTLKALGIGIVDSDTLYNYYKNALELKWQLGNILENLDKTLENSSEISEIMLDEIMELKDHVEKEQVKIDESIVDLEVMIKASQEITPSEENPEENVHIQAIPEPLENKGSTQVITSSESDETEEVEEASSEKVKETAEKVEKTTDNVKETTDNVKETTESVEETTEDVEETTEAEVNVTTKESHIGGGSDITPEMLFVLMQMDQAKDDDSIEALETKITELEEILEKNNFIVYSKIDGIVVKTNKEKSNSADYEMLVLDNTSLIAEVYVGKNDAERIQVGQKVEYPNDNLDLKGEVIYKSVIAESKSSPDILDSLGSLPLSSDLVGGEPKVIVKLSIDGADATRLVIGFDINAEVEIESVENVLAIPTESIILDRNKYFVYYADEEQILSRKEIDVGLIGENLVEVMSGLEEGSWLVKNPNATGLVLGEKIDIIVE